MGGCIVTQDLQFDASCLTTLIVDDHVPIRKAIRRVLSSMKFSQILEVSDGSEAIKLLQTKPIDLIICDLYMRQTGGFQVIQHIRDREVGSDTPIIVVTGEGSKEDIVRTVDLGADDYLLKPFHAEDLEKKVISILNKFHSPGTLLQKVRLAERHLFQKNYLKALATIEEALKIDEKSMRARHAQAVVLDKLSQSEKAIELLRKNIGLNASYYKNYGTLGDILLRHNQPGAAVDAFRKELHLNPKNSQRQIQLGKLLLQNHDTEGAIYHFRQALKENPKFAVALMGMGRAYAAHDNLDKALYYFKRLRRYHPTATVALEAIVKYAQEAGEAKKAELILKDEKNQHPDRHDTYIALAKLYAANQRKEDALAILDELAKKLPDCLPALKFRGELLAHFGHHIEAIAVFKEALAIDADPKILMKLAETYLTTQNYSEAIDAYHRALSVHNNHAAIFFGLAQAYLSTKQITKAFHALSKASSKGLENPTLLRQHQNCLKIIKTRRNALIQSAS